MIFSQWQADGGFDYYESSKSIAIGDDVPTPKMPQPSGGIGVPAQDVGFPLPGDAKYIGSGNTPRGIMAPMARDNFKSIGQHTNWTGKLSHNEMVVVLFLLGALGMAAWVNRKGS